jgi:hypothetical protein
MEFENTGEFENVIDIIRPAISDLKVYGVYRKGNQV